jgi:hypothetical protein
VVEGGEEAGVRGGSEVDAEVAADDAGVGQGRLNRRSSVRVEPGVGVEKAVDAGSGLAGAQIELRTASAGALNDASAALPGDPRGVVSGTTVGDDHFVGAGAASVGADEVGGLVECRDDHAQASDRHESPDLRVHWESRVAAHSVSPARMMSGLWVGWSRAIPTAVED